MEKVTKLTLVVSSKDEEKSSPHFETKLELEGDLSPTTVSSIMSNVGYLIESMFPKQNLRTQHVPSRSLTDSDYVPSRSLTENEQDSIIYDDDDDEEYDEELIEYSDNFGWMIGNERIEEMKGGNIYVTGEEPFDLTNENCRDNLKAVWNLFGICFVKGMGNSSSTKHMIAFPPNILGLCGEWNIHDFPVCSCPSYKYKKGNDRWCKHVEHVLRIIHIPLKNELWYQRPENLPDLVKTQYPTFESS